MTHQARSEPASPAVAGQALSIAEVSSRTGLSKDTLRYYEKAGLIDAVPRAPGGHRRYAGADLEWITFLLRLRETGMPIAGMQRFARLRRAGASSAAQRLEMLRAHEADVRARVAALSNHLGALETKIEHYESQLEGPAETREP